MKHLKQIMVPVIALLLVLASSQASMAKEVVKTFKSVGNVKVKLVSGNCTVETGKSNEIHVVVKYTYSDDDYKPVFKENGNTLVLKEEFLKSNVRNGKSDWTITVPVKTAISCSAASGNFKAAGLRDSVKASLASGNIKLEDIGGAINIETASGNMKVTKAKGDIDASAASGNIILTDVTGRVKAKAASGNIKATGITLTGEGVFKVASGNIKVILDKSPEHDVKIKAASGNVYLDYNGNELKGTFEIKGIKDSVSVPSNFSEQSSKYTPFGKWHYSNGNTPEIIMKNSTGNIILKK